MPLADIDRIHIHPVPEPARLMVNLHIVAAHLPLPHQPGLGKRPILKAVRAPPLAGFVVPFVPELHRDLVLFAIVSPPNNPSHPSHD